jgi:hypothetical protein
MNTVDSGSSAFISNSIDNVADAALHQSPWMLLTTPQRHILFNDVGHGCYPPHLFHLRRCGPWSTCCSVTQNPFQYEPLMLPSLAITNPPLICSQGAAAVVDMACYPTSLFYDMAYIVVRVAHDILVNYH